MFKRLTYSNAFPPNLLHPEGLILKGTYDFKTGLTGIVGPNESGKSFILEMLRFMLFGNDAFRGVAADYKQISGELEFELRGETYRIERRRSKATLYRGDVEIAVGTKPVNVKMVELLGFGLKVFDTACACTQGQIEALGTMQPSERKRMVDTTIGIGVLDDLIKWTADEALIRNRQVEALEKGLVEPQEPIQAETYVPSEHIEDELAQLRLSLGRLNELRGWMKNTRQEPVKPQCPVTEPVEVLQQLVDARGAILLQARDLDRRIEEIPPAKHSAEEIAEWEAKIAAYDRGAEKQVFLATHKRPNYTRAELERHLELNNIQDRWKERWRLEKRIKELEEVGTLECPSCNHSWPCEHAEIDRLKVELEKFADLDPYDRESFISRAEINKEMALLDAWEAVADRWEALKDVEIVPHPAVYPQDVERARRALERQEEREQLVAERAALVIPEDRSADLKARQRYEAALHAYEAERLAYQVWLAEKIAVEEELKAILAFNPEKFIVEAEAHLKESRAYEQAVKAYAEQMAVYQKRKEEVDQYKLEAEQWGAAKAAIQTLKSRVKGHLVPSLNRVASTLLSQMTYGKRQTIEVDEEFDVMVDGQRLNTLSGSGKAVANLALRLGLGQVLTNGVFSVFLADEIDAAMDTERAGATAECLRALTSHIKQIVLVSHKEPDADHLIDLGEAA